jgi:hypothetical protein
MERENPSEAASTGQCGSSGLRNNSKGSQDRKIPQVLVKDTGSIILGLEPDVGHGRGSDQRNDRRAKSKSLGQVDELSNGKDAANGRGTEYVNTGLHKS